jgi:uncharacterized SAM-binding protein YcdF (DUF218 family)
MLIFKILQQLLIPSSFILFLILIGLFFLLALRKKKTGFILTIFGVLFYYFLSIAFTANILLSPLEEKYSFLPEKDVFLADKAVLLLGGREADVLRGSEILRLSHLSGQNLKIIISGTDPVLPDSEEALGVKQFFVARGLEEKNIIIEGQSHNTWENVRNVKEIVEEEPFFLVTSAYHMERAMREFRKVEANPIPAPTDFKAGLNKDYNAFTFLPNAQNLKRCDLAIHEYLGIIWYKIKD